MNKFVWFVDNFNRFPARVQVMWAVLVIQFALVILLFSTGWLGWSVAFFVLVPIYWAVRWIHWGGKSMDTVLEETVDKWEKEDAEEE